MINLTQHAATPEQIAAGVVDLPPAFQHHLKQLLTFDTLPTREEILYRADAIATEIIPPDFHTEALIGGAPYLMEPLRRALEVCGITAYYAFSERVSEEMPQPDGSVRKVNVFKHVGFIKA